jgi:hypothetical protein
MRAGRDAHLTRHRLHRFLAWSIASQIPELLILAVTVDSWWPEMTRRETSCIGAVQKAGR